MCCRLVCGLLTDAIIWFYPFKLACCSLRRRVKRITRRHQALFNLLSVFSYRGAPVYSSSHRVHPKQPERARQRPTERAEHRGFIPPLFFYFDIFISSLLASTGSFSSEPFLCSKTAHPPLRTPTHPDLCGSPKSAPRGENCVSKLRGSPRLPRITGAREELPAGPPQPTCRGGSSKRLGAPQVRTGFGLHGIYLSLSSSFFPLSPFVPLCSTPPSFTHLPLIFLPPSLKHLCDYNSFSRVPNTTFPFSFKTKPFTVSIKSSDIANICSVETHQWRVLKEVVFL